MQIRPSQSLSIAYTSLWTTLLKLLNATGLWVFLQYKENDTLSCLSHLLKSNSSELFFLLLNR